jgi:quercetin dioxygenase-like cupin family protein
VIAFNLDELDLVEGWVEDQPRLRGHFAFCLTGADGAAASSVIYFEIAPGDAVLRHTHTAEEVLLVLAGSGEAEVAGERAPVRRGTVAVVPPHAPHSIVNAGDEILRVVGFFAAAGMVSTYEAPIAASGSGVTMTSTPNGAIGATGLRDRRQHEGSPEGES